MIRPVKHCCTFVNIQPVKFHCNCNFYITLGFTYPIKHQHRFELSVVAYAIFVDPLISEVM